ncbi:MAG: hypothetical protein RL207_1322 [Bacteroidota bacterium]|jgi:predicted GH43/DUF377 family glycosyl hydrolase
MLAINRGGIILETTQAPFENHGVLNPAVLVKDGIIHLFYRAVGKDFISSIGYCQLDSPFHVLHRNKTPLLKPLHHYEQMGVEDPRMVEIDNLFYLSYTAYDGVNALCALMRGENFEHFERLGIIAPLIPLQEQFWTEDIPVTQSLNSKAPTETSPFFIWDKNLVFFPRRINGELCFFHRIKPNISIVFIKEIRELTPVFWVNYLSQGYVNDLTCPSMINAHASYVGAGCPPIEIPEGWLFIYHAAYEGELIPTYKAHILLLAIDNPLNVIAELPYPILAPDESYERNGNVNHVVFPTGAFIREDILYFYYGAADRCIACAYFSVPQLLSEFTYLSN